MDRRLVHFLIPGQSLKEAMYDEEGRLLPERGHTLTNEMTNSLL